MKCVKCGIHVYLTGLINWANHIRDKIVNVKLFLDIYEKRLYITSEAGLGFGRI
jgi:hypothetical protein